MSLCLTMIVKNEAHIIVRCLRSAKPFIDYYSISDTGSTDNTMELISGEMADIPGVLTSDPWSDFSTNRNIALSRAKGDYILTLDADETLEHTDGTSPDLSANADLFFVKMMVPGGYLWDPRVFRNDTTARYKGLIHETITFERDVTGFRLENVWITGHFDSAQNLAGNKLLGHVAILEKEPSNFGNVFHLAMSLEGLGRFEEAIEKYNECVRMDQDREYSYLSLWRMAEIWWQLHRPWQEIAVALRTACNYRPSRLEARAALCDLLAENNLTEDVYYLSRELPLPSHDRFFIDPTAEWRILGHHAFAAGQLGKFEEALEYFKRIETYDLPAEEQAKTRHNLKICEERILASQAKLGPID